MTFRHLMGYAATAVLACASGWLMHDGSADSAAPAAPAARTASPARQQAAASQVQGALIAVASDGNVTLRVEQQPLEWVLDEIARQSGWDDVHQRAGAGKPAAGSVAANANAVECADPVAVPPAQAQQVLHKIQRGGDDERRNGLLQARADGVALPEDTLRTLVETDASDSVRLLAFDELLEARSGDTAALRSTLEAGLYTPNQAVQREARRRLDELRESERIDAANIQRATD